MSVGVQEVAWKHGWFLFPYMDIETGECGVVKPKQLKIWGRSKAANWLDFKKKADNH